MAKKKEKLSREERQRLKLEKKAKVRQYIKEHPVLFTVYLVLRIAVVLVMVRQAMNGEYYDVFLCALTLLLFMIPSFIERRLHIDVPNVLEVIILLFIFSAEILGEIQEYYIAFPVWDDILHTTNGFLMAAIGLAMVDILNRSSKFKVRLSPAFAALVAFCFSMTIGVIWEFFEYGMDIFFLTDMQKDTWVSAISTVSINPTGANDPVQVAMDSVVINGEAWQGYLDIGIHDTMKDLFVNFIGATVFSLIGMMYLMGRGKGLLLKGLVPHVKEQELSSAKAKGEESALLSPVEIKKEKKGSALHPDCIFCKIVSGDAPSRKIYEDEDTLAFLDVAGDALGHTLVIPKQHCVNVLDTGNEVAEQVMRTVKLVSEHYVSNCGFDGVNILNASGESAQQSVSHLHFHIIPRKSGDGMNTWPELPGDDSDLDEICKKLTMIKDKQNG